jgi:hypothetical protein
MNFNLKHIIKFNIVFLIYTFTNCVDANSQVVPHGLMHNKAYTENSIFADAQFRLYYSNNRPYPSIKSDFSFNFNNNTPYTFQFQYSLFDETIYNNREFEIPLIGFTNQSSLDTATAIILYSFKSWVTRNTGGIFLRKEDKIVQYVLNSNKDFSKNLISTTNPYNTFSSGVITTVYNGQSWKNYKNGILVNEIINTTIWSGSGNLIIGNGTRKPEHDKLNLFYDEIRFWNRALSATEVSNNWNKPIRGDETGLQVYYNFNNQGYPSYLRFKNYIYNEPAFDLNNNNVKYLNDLSPNKFKGTFLNCELKGYTNNFYRMTSDTYKNNFDSLIFHFDANNLDSYPGTGKNNNGTQINSFSSGKIYNLNGFKNNLQFYNNSNYNNITSFLFYSDGGRSLGLFNIYGKTNLNTGLDNDWSLTFEVWVKLNSLDNISVASIGENYDGNRFEMAVLNNKLILNVGGNNQLSSKSSLILNKWYHIVCTYDSWQYNIFINGINERIGWYVGPPPYVPFTENDVLVPLNIINTPLYIGTSQRPFNGKIGILNVYNRAISSTEILKKYNATKARFGY